MKQKTNPEISVIMSTYNEPLKWIAESIDSILNQTYKDFEFIIINDNPKRKELQKFLEKYRKQDERIILIKNKKNLGLTKSLNKELKKAKGKYIARMDADDVSLPKRFETQYNFLEKNPKIFLCGTSALKIDEEKNIIGQFKKYQNSKLLSLRLPFSNRIIHTSIMFKNNSEKYNEKYTYTQDYEFYLRMLLKNKKIINLNKILVKYRINRKSVSFTQKKRQEYFKNKAIKEYKLAKINIIKEKIKKLTFTANKNQLNLFLMNL